MTGANEFEIQLAKITDHRTTLGEKNPERKIIFSGGTVEVSIRLTLQGEQQYIDRILKSINVVRIADECKIRFKKTNLQTRLDEAIVFSTRDEEE